MVFGELIIIIALIVGFIFAFSRYPMFRFVSIIAALLVLTGITFKFLIKKYNENERAIIFRYGKFHRIAGPGWAVVFPFFEKEFAKVDVRTKMMPLNVPVAFTQDDLRLKLDGIIYYRIVNPDKAILKIDNYLSGLTNLISSQTRNLLASMSMREVFGSLSKLNDMLANSIRHETWKWGIDVPMVQLRGVSPPEEIAVAMQEKEIAAQSMQAQKFTAEAKRVVMEAIGKGAESLDDKAIMYLYLKALEQMSQGSGTKVVFPAQFMDVMKGGFGLGTGLESAGMDVNEAVSAIRNQIQTG